jgi:hypothetical protein
MGSALNSGLMAAHLGQQSFPALEDLPLFTPLPEVASTALIVAPEVALTRVPNPSRAAVRQTEIASVLSPSRLRKK